MYSPCTHQLSAPPPPPQPPRTVHPEVLFDTADVAPLLVENFPFDKYELEPSPLTQYILARRNPNFCWQVSSTPVTVANAHMYMYRLYHEGEVSTGFIN